MVETPVDIGLVPRRPREQALHQLRAWMAEGVWPPGMALPSERDLAQHLGLPRHQVRLALEDLTGQGFLVGQGRQRRVARPPAASTSLTSGALAIVCDQREPLPEGGAGASAGLVAGALAAAEAWSEANGGPVILLKRPISAAAVRELALSGLAGAVLLPFETESGALRGALAEARCAGLRCSVFADAANAGDHDSVWSDHAAGSAALTDWLLAQGCRRILRVWEGVGTVGWRQDRDRGHETALASRGIAALPTLNPLPAHGAQLVQETDFRLQVHALASQLLPFCGGTTAPDAVMAISDRPALLIAAALQLFPDAERRPLVVGYDHYWPACRRELSWGAPPPGATVDADNGRIGRELVYLLLARLAGRLAPPAQRRLVTPRLVITAPLESQP